MVANPKPKRVILTSSIKKRILKFQSQRSGVKNFGHRGGGKYNEDIRELHQFIHMEFPAVTLTKVSKWIKDHPWITDTTEKVEYHLRTRSRTQSADEVLPPRVNVNPAIPRPLPQRPRPGPKSRTQPKPIVVPQQSETPRNFKKKILERLKALGDRIEMEEVVNSSNDMTDNSNDKRSVNFSSRSSQTSSIGVVSDILVDISDDVSSFFSGLAIGQQHGSPPQPQGSVQVEIEMPEAMTSTSAAAYTDLPPDPLGDSKNLGPIIYSTAGFSTQLKPQPVSLPKPVDILHVEIQNLGVHDETMEEEQIEDYGKTDSSEEAPPSSVSDLPVLDAAASQPSGIIDETSSAEATDDGDDDLKQILGLFSHIKQMSNFITGKDEFSSILNPLSTIYRSLERAQRRRVFPVLPETAFRLFLDRNNLQRVKIDSDENVDSEIFGDEQ